MKTAHVVLAACAALAACSQEPAEQAPAGPKPITTADTGGRDLALTDAVIRLGPPMTVNWGQSGSGPTSAVRVSSLDVTVLNATAADIVDPSVTCLIGEAGHQSTSIHKAAGTVPAHGRLVIKGQHFGASFEPGTKVTCGVEAVFDRSRMAAGGPAQPLPGSIDVPTVEDKPAT